MCKYDFCYDALGKGSGEQEVWLNHTVTSTPASGPVLGLCWHLAFNTSSLPVGAPGTRLLNPTPSGLQTACSPCDDYCFPGVWSKPLPPSWLLKEEWQGPQERQLKFS